MKLSRSGRAHIDVGTGEARHGEPNAWEAIVLPLNYARKSPISTTLTEKTSKKLAGTADVAIYRQCRLTFSVVPISLGSFASNDRLTLSSFQPTVKGRPCHVSRCQGAWRIERRRLFREANYHEPDRIELENYESSEMCQVQTSDPWLDGMVSACATPGEYASFQSARAGYSPTGRVENSS